MGACPVRAFCRYICRMLGNGACRDTECISGFPAEGEDCPVSDCFYSEHCDRERDRRVPVFRKRMVKRRGSVWKIFTDIMKLSLIHDKPSCIRYNNSIGGAEEETERRGIHASDQKHLQRVPDGESGAEGS